MDRSNNSRNQPSDKQFQKIIQELTELKKVSESDYQQSLKLLRNLHS